MPGYKSCVIYRSDQGGRGIKLYYLEAVDLSVVSEFTGLLGSCESILVKCHIPGFGALMVASIYRPPQTSLNYFFDQLADYLAFIGNSKAVFMGDFNINTLGESNIVTNYFNLFSQFGYSGEINSGEIRPLSSLRW